MDAKLDLHPPTPGVPVFSWSNQIATPDDYAACRQVMRAASKNYSSASNYLPAERLKHVEALYALMRVGDDRVDVTHQGFSSALEAIDDWERTYWHAFERGDSPHPVMRAYLNTAMTCGIPKEVMANYFRAMRDDLTITRFPTYANLLSYMEGSAIPVGRAMTYILGVRPPWSLVAALPGADALSVAMQLSNFWRDVDEDLQRGRIYIPQEDMERFGVKESDLSGRILSRNFIDLLDFEFERTEGYYRQAGVSVKMLASGRWAVMSALEIYRAILSEIRARKYNVFSGRVGASGIHKLALAIKSYWHVTLKPM